MEYVEGQSLARLVEENGPLPVAEACDCARQAALGLQHAHEHGMVHRDVKPQNLMRTAGGVVKILDFGLARLGGPAEAGAPLTQAGAVMGTPDYMAPEQAGSPHAADSRADIYSLGCTLCFLLASHPPFPEGTFLQKLAGHLKRMPPPLAALRPDVPAELSRLVERMLAKDPAQRFQTPEEVARALEPFLKPAARRRRRWPLVVAAAGLLLATLAGVAVYRIVTDTGELEIRTDDPDIQVLIEQAGKEVTVLDARTRQKIELHAGEYTARLGQGAAALQLSTDRVTLSRGDRKIVEVRRLPPAPPRPKGTEIVHELRRFTGYREAPTSVALSPDGKLGLSGHRDGGVCLWDTETGRLLHRFPNHPEMVWSVAFSPDGRLAASGGGGGYPGGVWNPGTDHNIRVWDVAGRKQYRDLHGHTSPVAGLAFSPDGSRLVSGDLGGGLRLWDVSAARELGRLADGPAWGAVAFHPRKPLVLCTGADSTPRLWDLTTGEVVRRFRGHARAVKAVAFSPDGRLALTGSLDRTARLWDVATGEQRLCLPHPTVVECVAFSADGRRALSGSGGEAPPGNDAGTFGAGRENVVRLWDVTTGEETYRLDGHEEIVEGLAVSADGRFALSGSFYRTLRLWPMPASSGR